MLRASIDINKKIGKYKMIKKKIKPWTQPGDDKAFEHYISNSLQSKPTTTDINNLNNIITYTIREAQN